MPSIVQYSGKDTIADCVTILDGSGNPITSFGGTGGTASTFGAAFPTTGTAIGAKDSGGTLMQPLNLDASGNLKTTTAASTSTTSTLSNVSTSTSNATVLASNASRLGFTIYNDASDILYVKLGTTASSTSFVKQLLPGDFFGTKDLGVNYTGRIDAILKTGTGTARVTELT